MPQDFLGYADVYIDDLQFLFEGDPCKVLVLGGGNFVFDFRGSSAQAADGTIWTQIFDTGFAGRSLGLFFENLPKSIYDQAVEIISAKMKSLSTFNVRVKDDLHDINQNCVWDFSKAPDGPLYDRQLSNDTYFKDVTFMFLST